MRVICDLHIHSRFSGGSSNNITLHRIANNCKIKGINVIGTGDACYPIWLNELESNLEEYSEGIYFLPEVPEVKFILQTEVELIWKKDNQTKKVHFIVLIPSFYVLYELEEYLAKYGNLKKDGRPKIYLSAENFILDLKNIDFFIEIIPAHIFTPFYGVLGSMSNFRSLHDAVGNGIHYINAVESGLSADPKMIRYISELNNMSVISNSDAHSISFHRIGREATVFELNTLEFKDLINAIHGNNIIMTYEFKPSEGKYFWDGHRAQRHSNKKEFSCHPKENVKFCPICGNNITKGVLSRVYQLKDQNPILIGKAQYIVPLLHLISKVCGGTEYDKDNIAIYQKIVRSNNGEFNVWNGNGILKDIPVKILQVIDKIKKNRYSIIPGYDGVYGKLELDNYRELKNF